MPRLGPTGEYGKKGASACGLTLLLLISTGKQIFNFLPTVLECGLYTGGYCFLMDFIKLSKYIIAMLFPGIVYRFNIHIAYKTLLAKLGYAFFHPLAELLISMR